jgi:hypothetical protein
MNDAQDGDGEREYSKVVTYLTAPPVESAQRVTKYLNEEALDRYVEQDETQSQAISRGIGYTLAAGKQVVSLFGVKFRVGFEAVNLAYQHGRYALFFAVFKGDIQEIISMVLNIMHAARIRVNITADDIIRGLPYKLAHSEAATQMRRQILHGSGRVDPKTLHLSEERPPITEDIWGEICHYAYFACEYAYSTPPEAQRNIEQYRGVSKALLPEPYTLVLVRSGVGVERPAFHLVAHRATKQLVLVIRGSANALDWLANFRFRSETVYVPRVQVNRVNGEKVHGGLLCLGRVRGYTMASCSVLWR